MNGILFARNKEGTKILIGASENKTEAKWHDATSSGVIEIVKKLIFNSKVEFQSQQENGKYVLTFIKPLTSSNSIAPQTSSPTPNKEKTYYGKSPEEREEIKKLSILHSIALAVAPLTGQVDVNNIGTIIETLYDKFYKKLSNL